MHTYVILTPKFAREYTLAPINMLAPLIAAALLASVGLGEWFPPCGHSELC